MARIGNFKFEISSDGKLSILATRIDDPRASKDARNRNEKDDDKEEAAEIAKPRRQKRRITPDQPVVRRLFESLECELAEIKDEDEGSASKNESSAPKRKRRRSSDARARKETALADAGIGVGRRMRKHPHMTLEEEKIVEADSGDNGESMSLARCRLLSTLCDCLTRMPPPSANNAVVTTSRTSHLDRISTFFDGDARTTKRTHATSSENTQFSQWERKVRSVRAMLCAARDASVIVEKVRDVERIDPVSLASGSVVKLRELTSRARLVGATVHFKIEPDEIRKISPYAANCLMSSIHEYVGMRISAREDVNGLFSSDLNDKAVYLTDEMGIPCAAMYTGDDRMYVRAIPGYMSDLELLVEVLSNLVANAISAYAEASRDDKS